MVGLHTSMACMSVNFAMLLNIPIHHPSKFKLKILSVPAIMELLLITRSTRALLSYLGGLVPISLNLTVLSLFRHHWWHTLDMHPWIPSWELPDYCVIRDSFVLNFFGKLNLRTLELRDYSVALNLMREVQFNYLFWHKILEVCNIYI